MTVVGSKDDDTSGGLFAGPESGVDLADDIGGQVIGGVTPRFTPRPVSEQRIYRAINAVRGGC